MVADPTCQHILAEDGDGGRDGLVGVVVEGEVVGIDCLLLEPEIGKIKKNRKQWNGSSMHITSTVYVKACSLPPVAQACNQLGSFQMFDQLGSPGQ